MVVDVVQILEDRAMETLFYYEQNWKKYREQALSDGVISGYQILALPKDSKTDFDLLLMTEYPNQEAFQAF